MRTLPRHSTTVRGKRAGQYARLHKKRIQREVKLSSRTIPVPDEWLKRARAAARRERIKKQRRSKAKPKGRRRRALDPTRPHPYVEDVRGGGRYSVKRTGDQVFVATLARGGARGHLFASLHHLRRGGASVESVEDKRILHEMGLALYADEHKRFDDLLEARLPGFVARLCRDFRRTGYRPANLRRDPSLELKDLRHVVREAFFSMIQSEEVHEPKTPQRMTAYLRLALRREAARGLLARGGRVRGDQEDQFPAKGQQAPGPGPLELAIGRQEQRRARRAAEVLLSGGRWSETDSRLIRLLYQEGLEPAEALKVVGLGWGHYTAFVDKLKRHRREITLHLKKNTE